jgi:hypothetical protein
VSRILIGRSSERQQVAALLAHARARRSSALVVVGDPGVGKSTLLDDAVESAGGFLVLRTTGFEMESDLPFAGLSAILAPVANIILDDSRPTGGSAHRRARARGSRAGRRPVHGLRRCAQRAGGGGTEATASGDRRRWALGRSGICRCALLRRPPDRGRRHHDLDGISRRPDDPPAAGRRSHPTAPGRFVGRRRRGTGGGYRRPHRQRVNRRSLDRRDRRQSPHVGGCPAPGWTAAALSCGRVPGSAACARRPPRT